MWGHHIKPHCLKRDKRNSYTVWIAEQVYQLVIMLILVQVQVPFLGVRIVDGCWMSERNISRWSTLQFFDILRSLKIEDFSVFRRLNILLVDRTVLWMLTYPIIPCFSFWLPVPSFCFVFCHHPKILERLHASYYPSSSLSRFLFLVQCVVPYLSLHRRFFLHQLRIYSVHDVPYSINNSFNTLTNSFFLSITHA